MSVLLNNSIGFVPVFVLVLPYKSELPSRQNISIMMPSSNRKIISSRLSTERKKSIGVSVRPSLCWSVDYSSWWSYWSTWDADRDVFRFSFLELTDGNRLRAVQDRTPTKTSLVIMVLFSFSFSLSLSLSFGDRSVAKNNIFAIYFGHPKKTMFRRRFQSKLAANY